MTPATLRLADLSVSIGPARLLDGVSLEVAPGRIVAVVGPNGAGKTTLLDAISGTVASSGTVAIDGSSRHRADRPRAGVGRVFQGSPLPGTLTVAEISTLVAGTRARAAALLDRFGLRPHASSFVAELSTGMRRILDLAVATVGTPKVLLLDEPSSGLAQAEIDHLAELLLRWRDATGAAVLLVEHDASLVRAVADEVVILDAGRVVAHGSPREVLRAPRRASRERLRSPHDERFRAALAKVAEDAAPAPPPVKRSLSTWTLMRLGLREFAAGMSSVLILGVLNRVMKVELGISLGIVAAVLASYNLAAPVALGVGHLADTRPIAGRRRTPYIVAGSTLVGLAVAGAPHVAGRLAEGVTPASVVLSVLLFLVMGFGIYGGGTVFLALLADVAPPAERGHAASVAWLELMAGILFGVALTGSVLESDASNISTLFALAGVLIPVLTAIGVWGMERRVQAHARPAPPAHESPGFRRSVRGLAGIPQAKLFFGFMLAATFFLFLQQAVLEPFGGDVLGLSVRATSSFNALMTIGTVIGMVVAGRRFTQVYGHRAVATFGLACSVVAFGGLAGAAATSSVPQAWLSILFVGLAVGTFSVASLAMMMGMADPRRTALFMGAWTLARSLADGAATSGGGLIYEAARALTDSVPGGYATVFGLQAVGLGLCIPLIRAIDPERFAKDAAALPRGLTTASLNAAALAAEAAAGALPPGAVEIPEPVPSPPAPIRKATKAGARPRSANRRTPAKRPARSARAAPKR